MRRGGGGGRQFHNSNPRPLMTMGSLVSSQNQFGLQDIDLELELLKRKREIIEKQQEMLRNEYSGESSFSVLSQMYSEPRGGGYYGEGSGAGKKRPNVWEHDAVAPKRFNSNAGPRHTYTSQSQFKSSYKPKNPTYQPRAQSNFNSYKGKSKPPPAKKRSDFNPSKVTKQSSAQPPNKLKNYAAADAQKLVSSAVKASEQVDEKLILRADREPSNQLQGRLGLALGFLVKEIKAQFPQYEDMFKNMTSQLVREMKLALRERLRIALMGKYVGSLDQVLKIYREVYPPDTDREIVMRILEKESGLEFIHVESDDPHEFYIQNIGVLMSRKMDEMFAKLSEMYRIDQVNRKNTKYPPKDKKGDPKDDITIVDITKEEKPETMETSTNGDENTPKIEQENEVENEIKDEVKNDQNKDNTVKEEQKKKKNEEILKKYISMSAYQELDRLMSAKLPILLRRFVPQIQKLLKLDLGYRRCANQVRIEVKKKLNPIGAKAQPIPVDDDEQEKDEKKKASQYVPLPYFVKILGRPSLPKRKQMQEFFEKYKPRSIKKHRTVHNLLFVGFTEKESFDNILKEDGIQIGRFTLSIKVSERSNKPQENEEQVQLINTELDEQITDLLDSIKKSEGITNDEQKQDEEVIEIPEKNDVVEVTDEDLKLNADDGKVTDDKKEGDDVVGDQNDVTVIDDSSQDVTMIDDNSQGETINLDKAGENGENDSQNQVSEKTKTENVEANEENSEDTGIDNSEIKNETENSEDTQKDVEEKDTVSELKNPVKDVKSTPTRASARLATTPSSVKTRRASKLTTDNNS